MNTYLVKRIAAHLLVGSVGIAMVASVLFYALWLLLVRGEISLADQPVLLMLFVGTAGLIRLAHMQIVLRIAPYPAEKYTHN